MNGRYLLDTNVVIAFLTADQTFQRPDPSSELYISSTVIGELFYGALNSNKIDDNIQRLLDFVRDAVSVPCDAETARNYGELKAFLRRKRATHSRQRHLDSGVRDTALSVLGDAR
jgi:tRNA(fMet)-specific endonuclease VapC